MEEEEVKVQPQRQKVMLTHATPEGSVMYNPGPSGPYEANITLQPNGRTELYSV